MRKTVQERH